MKTLNLNVVQMEEHQQKDPTLLDAVVMHLNMDVVLTVLKKHKVITLMAA